MVVAKSATGTFFTFSNGVASNESAKATPAGNMLLSADVINQNNKIIHT